MGVVQAFIAVALVLGGFSAYSLTSTVVHSIQQARIRSRVRNRVRGTDVEASASETDPSVRAVLIAAGIADSPRIAELVRLVRPILERFESSGYHDQESLRSAGLEDYLPGDRFLRSKLVFSVLGAASIGVILIGSPPPEVAIFMIGGAFLGFRLPRWIVRRSAAKRVARCVADLPGMIDMIAMGSEAGLSFDAACALYCDRYDSPLAWEMRRMASMYRTGSMSREAALLDLADRLKCEPIGRFVSSTTQSLRLGAPLADMLATQADDARRAYRSQLEEQIAKAPVKMLIPMGTLILPAMLLLVLGPVVVGMSSGAGI